MLWTDYETEVTAPVNTRPRNRKEQLTDAAAELFRRHGYHGVSVNDIAAAAGVTGPAVYRHFRGKQDVLAHVLLSGLDKFGLVTDEALARDKPLHSLVEAVSALAVERREVTALWRWQGRHLDKADQIKIRKRGSELMGDWTSALRETRPLSFRGGASMGSPMTMVIFTGRMNLAPFGMAASVFPMPIGTIGTPVRHDT